MNRGNRILGVLLIVGLITGASLLGATPAKTDIEVYFSPKGGCTDAIVRELDKARGEVLVQAFTITSSPIAQAISKAYARGVKVVVILDESQLTDHYSSATYLSNHGVPCFVDGKHAIAHNKIMVIDDQTVITGSFNFTVAAEKDNAENLVIMHRPELAAKYSANFKEHFKHSVPYKGS